MMKIESTKPVHWQITCQMETSDVRAAMRMVLKPSVLLRIVKMALGKGSSAPKDAATPELAGKTG